MSAKKPTFAEKRTELLDFLARNGWKLSDRNLKIPHATSPSGEVRLWFKPQAIYYSYGLTVTQFKEARSLAVDSREWTGERLLNCTFFKNRL